MGFWAERPHGIDFFEKWQSTKNTKSRNCPKIVRNGYGKVLPGSREVRMDQNCAPSPMECLPDPKTTPKIEKIPKTQKIPSLLSPMGGFTYVRNGFGVREAFHWIRCIHPHDTSFARVLENRNNFKDHDFCFWKIRNFQKTMIFVFRKKEIFNGFW